MDERPPFTVPAEIATSAVTRIFSGGKKKPSRRSKTESGDDKKRRNSSSRRESKKEKDSKVSNEEEQTSSKQKEKSNFDEKRWKEELDRVAPHLLVGYKVQEQDDWRSDFAAMQKLHGDVQAHSTSIIPDLSSFHQESNAVLQTLELEETKINEMFQGRLEEYKAAKRKKEENLQKRDAFAQEVQDLKQEASELEASHAAIQKKLSAKSRAMTDTAPLVEMKTALQTLKAENKEFDLRIAVLMHSLWQAKLDTGNPQEFSFEEENDTFDEDDENLSIASSLSSLSH